MSEVQIDTKAVNPANVPAVAKVERAERMRVPMSLPRQKLEAPEIQGYHTHWFKTSNVIAAQRGGYELVKDDEISLNQFGVGNDNTLSGNADLGTNVSIPSGIDGIGKPENLILMKIKMEWWLKDQKTISTRNASVMSSIFTKEEILDNPAGQLNSDDKSQRYVKQALFNRPKRKV
jgi:hypothetical protein